MTNKVAAGKQVFCIFVLTMIFSIVLIGSDHDSALALTCVSQYMSTQYEKSSSVFSGKVIDIEGIFLSENVNYRFEVDRVFKGYVPDVVDVEVLDYLHNIDFREGHDYVVFSKTNFHIPYYVQYCDHLHLHPTKTILKLLETGAPTDFIDSDGNKVFAVRHHIEKIMESDEIELLNQIEKEELDIHSGFTNSSIGIPYFPLFWYILLAGVASVVSLFMVLCHVYKKSEINYSCICSIITQNKLVFASAVLLMVSFVLCINIVIIDNYDFISMNPPYEFLPYLIFLSFPFSIAVLFVLWIRHTRWYLTIPLMALMLFWMYAEVGHTIYRLTSEHEFTYVSDKLIVAIFSAVAISFGIVSCVRWIVRQLKSGKFKTRQVL